MRVTESKKFVAFLISEMSWKLLLGMLLVFSFLSGELTTGYLILASLIVAVAGFMEVAYINGQAALDRYLGLAKLAVDRDRSFKTKDIEVGKPE